LALNTLTVRLAFGDSFHHRLDRPVRVPKIRGSPNNVARHRPRLGYCDSQAIREPAAGVAAAGDRRGKPTILATAATIS
jgi:hypothetical protein